MGRSSKSLPMSKSKEEINVSESPTHKHSFFAMCSIFKHPDFIEMRIYYDYNSNTSDRIVFSM